MSLLLAKRSLPPDGETQFAKRIRLEDESRYETFLDTNFAGSSPPKDHSYTDTGSEQRERSPGKSSVTTTQPGTPNRKSAPREKKFPCDYPDCDKAFTRPVRLAEHQRSHTNERPFVCDRESCGKAFLRDSHLKAHIKSHHEDVRDNLCDWPGCSKGFATRQKAREHRKRHEQREELKCTTCHQYFRKQDTLDRHVKSVHNTDPLTCDHVVNSETGSICGRGFRKYSALKQHQDRTHSGFKFFCHQCSPEMNEDDMDDSASQMPGIVGFASFSELQRHNKEAHPPVCHLCGQTCITEAKLRAHIDIEHFDVEERRTVPCKHVGCGRMFTRAGNMLVHYKSDHANQKFLCSPAAGVDFKTIPDWDGNGACGRGFSTKAALEKHVQTQHLHIPLQQSKGKEKRKARKARMTAQELSEQDNPVPPSQAADLLTGAAYDGDRQITCALAFCPQRFKRWYDLELHLRASHGYSDLAASDAADSLREEQAISGGQFWLGGDLDDEFEDLELATQLQAALGVHDRMTG